MTGSMVTERDLEVLSELAKARVPQPAWPDGWQQFNKLVKLGMVDRIHDGKRQLYALTYSGWMALKIRRYLNAKAT